MMTHRLEMMSGETAINTSTVNVQVDADILDNFSHSIDQNLEKKTQIPFCFYINLYVCVISGMCFILLQNERAE